jgi:hypothetical protein
VKIPKTAGFVLILLILQLTIAGCGSTPTQHPTDVPPPTATPDPNIYWPEFVDPWSRFSVHYPPDWHPFPAVFEDTGYATTISTINLGASGEPSHEVDLSLDDFAVWFTFDRADAVEGANLMAWVEARFHPGGIVLERTQESVSGASAVVEVLELHNGQHAKIVHYSTSKGVLSIFGQPWGNSQSGLFDLLLTTVTFQ